MKKAIQDSLLAVYRVIRKSGILETPAGRWLFLGAYRAYKRFWESDINHLRRYVSPGGWVVDIGANIGFFTERFCAWVSDGGRVLAFEPEQKNYDALLRMAQTQGFADRLIARRALVAEIDGELLLALNPDNPADHRIGAQGIPTETVRLDTVMAQLGWPRVSFVKIDVQGAEARVLGGARETLARHRPVLFVEIDDGALRSFGSSAKELQDAILALGYEMYVARDGVLSGPLDEDAAAGVRKELGYADFVFLPEPR
jgi:FkbM family methyltransferase